MTLKLKFKVLKDSFIPLTFSLYFALILGFFFKTGILEEK